MKNTLNGYAKFGGGGANKVHYGRRASDESSYLDQTSLVNKLLFFLLPNYRGFYSQRFVLLLFSILRVDRPPRHCYLIFSLTLSSVLCVNAKRSHGLSFFRSQPHEQLTVKATDEGNHFRFPKPVFLFKTVLKLTDPWLAHFGERRFAEQEVIGSSPGRTNTQRVFK